MAAPALVIFDCDGVLVDSEILEHTVDAELLSLYGYSATIEELIARFVGIARRDMYAAVFAGLGKEIPPGLLDDREQRVWARCRDELKAVPGVHAALEAMHDVPKCVASSSTPDKLQMKLQSTNLAGWFSPHIFSTALVERGKPAPDVYLHTAWMVGVVAAACVVIEDSPHGIAGAKAAGMTAYGFTGGGHATPTLERELLAAGANRVVGTMAELTTLLLA